LNLPNLKYPSDEYEEILTRIAKYFQEYCGVYAIVLTGSLARGKAVKGSCIDLFIFLEKAQLKALTSSTRSRAYAYSRLGGQVCYYQNELEGGIEFGKIRVDVGFTGDKFAPSHSNSFDITRDEFETTIGNLFVYSILLYEKGQKYRRIRQKYLPFYDDELRRTRLAGTSEEFRYKTWKTQWLAKRGEYFAAVDSLLEAYRIFLQHLFIKERKYPIDYVKWIKEQCSQILQMPNLYQELASVINGIELKQKTILGKSLLLEKIFNEYAADITSLKP
jgi:predicted nucleotidyltransferase